ncbi:hypothetical protein AeNC1_004432 [Aphanomyces euteiches]|nr:hypothetical protein AeNC1_004432 [Aphanomyces euteiches]
MSDNIEYPLPLSQTWTASANLTAPIEGLKLDIPGRVFVKHNASLDTPARVLVLSDTAEIINAIQWRVDQPVFGLGPVLEAKLFVPRNERLDVTGSLLIEVTVREPLSRIATSAETVVQEGSLLNGPADFVSVRSNDAANVYVTYSSPIELAGLDLKSNDEGSVQLKSPSIKVVGEFKLKSNDNGAVAVQADNIAAATITSTANDGSAVYLTATNLIEATHLHSNADDRGSINIYPHGVCQEGAVRAADSGRVNVGSVICQTVDARLADASFATVQAVQSLSTKVTDGGHVQYFNSTPTLLPVARGRHKKPSQATLTTENKFDEFKFQSIPAYEPVGVSIHIGRYGNVYIESFESHAKTTTALAATSTLAAGFEGGLVLAAICVVAIIGFVLLKHRRRAEYQPLLH